MSIMRLDKFFSAQNLATRKEVKSLLKTGVISVNAVAEHLSPDMKIDTEVDKIKLSGKLIEYKKYIYIMLNKPLGVVSATNDREHKTVLDLVPPELFREGLFPAGRLDKDTTGFILLTDDGDLAHKMLAPKSHISKVYHAILDGEISQKDIAFFKNGVVLKDGFECLPADISLLENQPEYTVEIILKEGKYHQVKRMAASIGRHVIALKRVKMGGMCLDPNLADGQCKEILHKDVEKFLYTEK